VRSRLQPSIPYIQESRSLPDAGDSQNRARSVASDVLNLYGKAILRLKEMTRHRGIE
jgi:hypothetical protein